MSPPSREIDQQLFCAAREGKADEVVRLIAAGAGINALSGRHSDAGQTPLMAACSNGRLEVVKVLLAHGADVAIQSEGVVSQRAQFYALMDCHFDVAKALVGAGDKPDPFGLIKAIEKNDDAMARFLIHAGTDLNFHTIGGRSPLCEAAEQGMCEIARLLLEKGADVDGKLENSTPLARACGRRHQEMILLLLDHGAEINTGKLSMPLLAAVHHGADNAKTIEMLLARGADVNLANPKKLTPLHAAPDVETAAMLLAHGAAIDARGAEESTALIHAATGKGAALVQYLLDNGADMHAKDINGKEAHFYAAREKRTDTVRLLVSRGAHLTTDEIDAVKKTWQWSGVPQDHEEFLLLLERSGALHADIRPVDKELLLAALNNDRAGVEMAINKGASLSARNLEGDTALSLAGKRRFHALEKMLEIASIRGMAVEEPAKGLLTAIVEGKSSLLLAQIKKGPPLETGTCEGNTPLLLAAKYGFTKAIAPLLAAGSNAGALNGLGCGAVELAAERGHLPAVQALLGHGGAGTLPGDAHLRAMRASRGAARARVAEAVLKFLDSVKACASTEHCPLCRNLAASIRVDTWAGEEMPKEAAGLEILLGDPFAYNHVRRCPNCSALYRFDWENDNEPGDTHHRRMLDRITLERALELLRQG